jgi:glycosyltransferase involved in cell wall biosynthesis
VTAGRRPTGRVEALAGVDGVEVHGDVADLGAELRAAWVAVAPMRLGAGIKNKVLEAWAAGRPVVMSRVAANGLAVADGLEQLVTDDRDEQIARIVELLRDAARRRTLGEAARRLARTRHSWGQCADEMSRLLLKASQGSRGHERPSTWISRRTRLRV